MNKVIFTPVAVNVNHSNWFYNLKQLICFNEAEEARCLDHDLKANQTGSAGSVSKAYLFKTRAQK